MERLKRYTPDFQEETLVEGTLFSPGKMLFVDDIVERLQLLRDVLLSDLSTSDQKAPQASLLELDSILGELA